jgi:uncharacterized membrane protein YcaP (DUF421 family)
LWGQDKKNKEKRNTMDVIKIILTSLLSVAALFVITKIMGHKQVAQLDFFDYVSGITIGSIGAELATDLEAPWKFLVALAIYGLVSVSLSLITHKFPKTRKYINGAPLTLFSNGKLYRENLKVAKLELAEFLLLCREAGYFNLNEIERAVFEYNGRLSVLPKSENRPLTPKDLSLNVPKSSPATELIMDGRVLKENLIPIGKNEEWLKTNLKDLGYKKPGEIFLAVYSEDEGISVFPMK